MVKKTATCTKMKPKKLHTYEIGFVSINNFHVGDVVAERFDVDDEKIVFCIDGEDVAVFQSWKYVKKVEIDESPEEPEQVKLPPNWGKVDGKKF